LGWAVTSRQRFFHNMLEASALRSNDVSDDFGG
jgi:hypothetical protein